jgi:hypothetical protein
MGEQKENTGAWDSLGILREKVTRADLDRKQHLYRRVLQ